MATIDELLPLLPNARAERLAHNVFEITVVVAEDDALTAAIETLSVFGEEAIAYHVYDTFGDQRVRITFRSGNVEPLLYYQDKRRRPSPGRPDDKPIQRSK